MLKDTRYRIHPNRKRMMLKIPNLRYSPMFCSIFRWPAHRVTSERVPQPLSYEQQIQAPSIQTSVTHDEKDLHVHIALRLGGDDLATLGIEGPTASPAPTRQQLAVLATRIYEARRTRYRMLDRDLFGEPAWDMLLALYCLPARGQRLSISGLSYAAELPQTTGHRWQLILAERELLEHVPDEGDARRQFVKLSNKGRELLELYLTRLFRCGNHPPL